MLLPKEYSTAVVEFVKNLNLDVDDKLVIEDMGSYKGKTKLFIFDNSLRRAKR